MRKFNAIIFFALIILVLGIILAITGNAATISKPSPILTLKPEKNFTPSVSATLITSKTIQVKGTHTIQPSLKITTRGQVTRPATISLAPVVKVRHMDSIMSGIYNQYPHLNYSFANYILSNPGKSQALVTVESEIIGYSEKSVNTITLAPGGKVQFNDTPLLVLSKIPNETTTASFHYKVSGPDGRVIDEKTIPVEIYPKDTMVWAIYDGNEYVDQSAFIAAWITPHISAIEKILRDAAELNPDHSIEGYQCDYCVDDHDWEGYTNGQVKAIYDALAKDYKIAYVDSSIAFGRNEDDIQRVHLPEESLASNSINCIDGTVLFASALEAAGLDPAIVLTPDHAFVGWWISPDSDSMDFLETTMIGEAPFSDALDEGSAEYDDEQSNGNFETNASLFLDIYELREMGIRPME